MLFDMERNGNTKPPKMKCKINNNNKIALKSCPPPFTPPKKPNKPEQNETSKQAKTTQRRLTNTQKSHINKKKTRLFSYITESSKKNKILPLMFIFLKDSLEWRSYLQVSVSVSYIVIHKVCGNLNI